MFFLMTSVRYEGTTVRKFNTLAEAEQAFNDNIENNSMGDMFAQEIVEGEVVKSL